MHNRNIYFQERHSRTLGIFEDRKIDQGFFKEKTFEEEGTVYGQIWGRRGYRKKVTPRALALRAKNGINCSFSTLRILSKVGKNG